MTAGFVAEHYWLEYGGMIHEKLKWFAGEDFVHGERSPVLGMPLGPKPVTNPARPLAAYRCDSCGLVQWYAFAEEPAGATE
jgi:hypothetical protein